VGTYRLRGGGETVTATDGALSGLRVVDFGQYIAGPLTAMLLADHGADVVRVDPPGGPRWKHPSNATLQRGKRSLVLDLKSAADHDIARDLIAAADVVVEGFRPGVMDRLGLGADELTAIDERLIYCSLPGFAHDDRRAQLQGWEGIVGAATGHYSPGFSTPAWARNADPGDADEPRFSALPLASVLAGIIATNSILAALIAREREGFGQTIEVPLFNAMFEVIGTTGRKTDRPEPVWRHAASALDAQCADGRWLMISLWGHRHYRWFADRFFPQEWLAEGLGDPERLLRDPALAEAAKARVVALLATKTSTEWERLISEAGIAVCTSRSTAEWLRDDHAHASRSVIGLDDPELGPTTQAGYLTSLSETPPRAQGPRHLLDADRADVLRELDRLGPKPAGPKDRPNTVSQALAGIRVLDLTTIVAGPTAGRILAEFGADVVKINQPGYLIINHLHASSGKKTMLLDVSRPAGKDVLWPLVEQADVFIQNMSRGTADRIGVGEEDVRRHRADITYCSISTYNYDGPRGGERGFEGFGQAATGLMLRWGGGAPPQYRFSLCDIGAGEAAATAILVSLLHRLRGGAGQHVQSSLVQAGTYHQLPFMIDYAQRGPWDEPSGRDARGWEPFDRLYETTDGWVYLVAREQDQRRAVHALTGVDAGDWEGLERVFRTGTTATWVQLLQDAGIAAHASVDLEDVMEDPWAKEQRLSIVRDHPGIGAVRLVGPAPRLSRTPVRVTSPAALPGAHTRQVVEEIGLHARYEELLAANVIADSLPDGEILVL
jgi:crotonobetainyl-CoA:carnitine CoA-transferase CaiB-like acyl-CoA transferase